MARLDDLARFSADADGLNRLYLTPAHAAAAARQVAAWMEEPDDDPARRRRDRGRPLRGGGAGAPTLLLGSHIDTVRHAGRYDGNLGVVTAIAAVQSCTGSGAAAFAVEVLAFGTRRGCASPSPSPARGVSPGSSRPTPSMRATATG